MEQLHAYSWYVVLIGDVGTGKSTIVEKLTGVTGRSSNSNESFTRETQIISSEDGCLTIADTPGVNAMSDTLKHNLEVAGALIYGDVPRIFLVGPMC